MKKVLYISNIEVPYRVRFFNELAKHCDLTVLYERKKSSNRDEKWTAAENRLYRAEVLGGVNIKNEQSFSLKILDYIFRKYDAIIVGCYNSPIQTFAVSIMKLCRIRYMLNLDGEVFVGGGFKSKLKKFFLKGADKYLVAGTKSAVSVRKIVGEKKQIIPYYFSSLSDSELCRNAENKEKREDFVLVVGQYFDYKGMDIALRVAEMNQSIRYKFVGMGTRTKQFISDTGADKLKNIEIIPFLQKDALEHEYKTCAALLLPSRQECWGLVINEAASFGTPIVSTTGSGAAIEFIADDYAQYLSEPNSPERLLECIERIFNSSDLTEYGKVLIERSGKYSIENSVNAHLDAFGIERRQV